MLTCCCLFRTFRNRAGSEAVAGSGSIRSEANFKHRHVFVFVRIRWTNASGQPVSMRQDRFFRRYGGTKVVPLHTCLRTYTIGKDTTIVITRRETSKMIGNHSTHEREIRVKTCKDNTRRNPKESVSL